MIRGTIAHSQIAASLRRSITGTLYSTKAGHFQEEDYKQARQWLASFSRVPTDAYEVTYSRASGPGGQNVNKYVARLILIPALKRRCLEQGSMSDAAQG